MGFQAPEQTPYAVLERLAYLLGPLPKPVAGTLDCANEGGPYNWLSRAGWRNPRNDSRCTAAYELDNWAHRGIVRASDA